MESLQNRSYTLIEYATQKCISLVNLFTRHIEKDFNNVIQVVSASVSLIY
jgi:hypothetical protein